MSNRSAPRARLQLTSLEDRITPHGDATLEAAALALVPTSGTGGPTHVAKPTGGNWNAAGTWVSGTVPGAGSRVHIPAGATVTVNATGLQAFTVRVDGTLQYATTVNTALTVDTVVVTAGGKLTVGTNTNRVLSGNVARMVFASGTPINTAADPRMVGRGLVALAGSDVEVYGFNKVDRTTATAAVRKGATSITVADVSGWAVGDQIVVTGTATTGLVDTNPGAANYQDEVRTVTAVNATTKTVSFGTALAYDHLTPAGMALYVANLTRNVRFETQNWNSTTVTVPVLQRAHTIMMTDEVDLYHAGFYGLGRTNKQEIVTDPDGAGNGLANPRGRYPVHLHKGGTAGIDRYSQVIGNAIWDSPGWGVALHGAKADINDNASFDVAGAHFVTEDGDERGRFRNNIAMYAPGDRVQDWTKLLESGSQTRRNARDFGERGMGFWFQSGYSAEVFSGNVITSAFGTGFIIYGFDDDGSLHKDVPIAGLPAPFNEIVIPPGNVPAGMVPAWHIPPQEMDGNITYNSRSAGEFRGVLRDDAGVARTGSPDAVLAHNVRGLVTNLTAWNVIHAGYAVKYSSHLDIRNMTVLGNPTSPILRGTGLDEGNDPKGTGFWPSKDARDLRLVNPRVEGFEYGLLVPQTFGQGYGEEDENPLGRSMLIGGTFRNNVQTFLPAWSRLGNLSTDTPVANHALRPFTPWFAIESPPAVTLFSGTTNQLPTANFASAAAGGLAVRFDGSLSADPDRGVISDDFDTLHSPIANDNDLAGYVWEFGDGTVGYGRYPLKFYSAAGTYSVKLTVFDADGQSASVTKSVTVGRTANGNAVLDPNFGESSAYNGTIGGEWGNLMFGNSTGTVGNVRTAGTAWFTVPSANGESWWAANDTADTADVRVGVQNGARGMVQLIQNQTLHRGDQTIRFRLASNNASNSITVQVYGVRSAGRGAWANLSPWNKNAPANLNGPDPVTVSTILTQTVTGATAGNAWQTFSYSRDFGTGYDWIAVRFWVEGYTSGSVLRLDDVFIGGGGAVTSLRVPAASVRPEGGSGPVDLSAAALATPARPKGGLTLTAPLRSGPAARPPIATEPAARLRQSGDPLPKPAMTAMTVTAADRPWESLLGTWVD